MNTKITAEALLNQLDRDPEIADAFFLFPMIIGQCPLNPIPTLSDFQNGPIAQREDGITTILASDGFPYSYLVGARLIDVPELMLDDHVPTLPNACRIVDEWDLVGEIVRRIELFKLGELPHYVCGQS